MAKLTGKNALICGDARTIQVTAPFDLTGYTVTFTVKPETALTGVDDTGATIQKVVTSHSDAVNGITLIELDTTDTRVTAGTYTFDVQFDDGAGNVTSSRRKDIEFVNDVTKA
jgi:hypothetical protein